MNRSIIAYDISALEKKKVLSEARRLFKNGLLDESQLNKIQQEFATDLFAPNIFMRILLFLVSIFGLSTVMGPIALIFGDVGLDGYRFLSLIFGGLLLFLTEKVLINDKRHYKSGVLEAGIYTGLSFIAFGILAFEADNILIYPVVGLILVTFAAIRYLDIPTLISIFFFLIWIIFQVLANFGGMIEALMPFVFMATFGLIYGVAINLEKKKAEVVFDNQFLLVKTLSLLLFYVAGNYFVVRELSIALMGLDISPQEDIPFAFIFYLFTALVPIAYIYFGIRQKSILLIRVGLFTIALSVITFKFYFGLGFPMLTITIAGAILIAVALVLFKILKQPRNGFTATELLQDNWSSQDLTAFIAAQTLGGNIAGEAAGDGAFSGGKGGASGGGGASDNW